MPRLPGKPSKVDRKIVITVLKKHKTGIIRSNNKVITKLDPVWSLISKELNNELSARTLYSMACNADIRRQISCKTPENDTSCDVLNDTSQSANNSNEVSFGSVEHDSSIESGSIAFTIWANKNEYEQLLEDKVYPRREASRTKDYNRICTILKPGHWQEWISHEVWKTARFKCAFNFHHTRVTRHGDSGIINGTCNCGGTILCKIDNCINTTDNETRIDCVAKRGKGQCGKRYLRAPIRKVIGKELYTKSATIYRSEKADELMLPGDPEPPNLYKKNALNNAKYEYLSSQYLDRDPVRAIQIMKSRAYLNAIHGIGLDPFYVHYWTNHQLHVYRAYAKQEPACIAIDATGSIVRPIENCDGSKSKHIFLYHCVIHNKSGQFSVSQMLSEKHTTVALSYWLSEWVSEAALYPKEVVCDSSKALLGAAVRTFTNHATIADYANACNSPVLPACFIRIDVAHFIKMYVNFLKNSPKRVKIFYLAVLGQLIQSRDVLSAGDILKSILMVARCETDGNLLSGRRTECDFHKSQLKNSINPCLEVPDEDGNTPTTFASGQDSIFDDDTSVNYWSSWGKGIDLEVRRVSEMEEGDHDNAHYLPAFADRLLSDIHWFPLWSSVCRDRFGYGRVPATSASVESEFNIIKTHLLKNDPKPMRVDVFLSKHLGYINGKTKIIDARATYPVSNNANTEDRGTTTPSVSDDTIPNIFNMSASREPISNTPCNDFLSESSPVMVSSDSLINRESTTTLESNLLPPLPKQSRKKADLRSCTLCSTLIRDVSEVEEGATICPVCTRLGSADKILTSREAEDWGGLTSESTKKQTSRYLTKNYTTFDAISSETLSKIPIMKNGNSTKLQASKFGKAQYSFTKTCAFDSILHIILVAACDRSDVNDTIIRLESENQLFHIVLDIMNHGLRAHSYQLRARVLIDIHQAVKSNSDNYIVDCEANVNYLIGRLFDRTPSLREISACIRGCETNPKPLRTCSVTDEAMKNPCIFEEVLTMHVSLPDRICRRDGCHAPVTTRYTSTGPFVIMEINDVYDKALNSIPKSFYDPLSNEHRFNLIGIVHFKPPAAETRGSTGLQFSGTGHYTAIILRPPEIWVEVDDLKNKPKRLSGDFKTTPHTIIYFKQRQELRMLKK